MGVVRFLRAWLDAWACLAGCDDPDWPDDVVCLPLSLRDAA